MERETAISLLGHLSFVIEAIAEECFADARSSLGNLISRLKAESEIESEERTALLNALQEAQMNLERIPGHRRGAAVTLARVSRELWENVVG
jgi:hypothetical protein